MCPVINPDKSSPCYFKKAASAQKIVPENSFIIAYLHLKKIIDPEYNSLFYSTQDLYLDFD